MHYELAQVSLQGDRALNQDRIGTVEVGHGLLVVVADGMGGHPRGELAAQVAVDALVSRFRAAPHPLPAPESFLREAVREAHRAVDAGGRAQRPPVEPRTTCVAALVQHGGVHWVHVGDSRLYLLRAGRVAARTRDHNMAEELLERGAIDAEARRLHPLRHYVTRCLGGGGDPEPELGAEPALEEGDVLLLCSDGLLSLSEERIVQAVTGPGALASALEDLARAAVEAARPASDNVSALALRCLPTGTGVHAGPDS